MGYRGGIIHDLLPRCVLWPLTEDGVSEHVSNVIREQPKTRTKDSLSAKGKDDIHTV